MKAGLTCPPDSAPAPAEVLPRGPSEVEKEEEEEEEVEREKEEAEVVVLVGLKASTKQRRLKHPSSLDMRNEEAIT